MVSRLTIQEQTTQYPVTTVERHLVYAYLQQHAIPYSESPVLAAYFRDYTPLPSLTALLKNLQFEHIKELENYLELLIPPDDRKVNGAFFTPAYITRFIIRELAPEPKHKNLDPSCGCGAFLVELVDYYKRTYGKTVRETVMENIFGADILEYNIRRTKLILAIYALHHGEVLEETDYNLWHQDSLQATWTDQFDNIVGNPPYVKVQDLSYAYRRYLLENWRTIQNGSYNIFFAFFELGYRLLVKGGKLGYITPNNYFTSLAGEALRKFFHQHRCIYRIIDFGHKPVFQVQAYTAISFISKMQCDDISYDRINDHQDPENFLAHTIGTPTRWESLSVKRWRMLKVDELENIYRIEHSGTALGKTFEITAGIATLKDTVYLIDNQQPVNGYFTRQTKKGTFKIEEEITQPLIKISDIKNADHIRQNERRIICPYIIHKNSAIPYPEDRFRDKFPECYKYLLSEKDNLLTREKGKKQYAPFYSWGRTQGLTKTGQKIITPTFSRQPRFNYAGEEGFFTNGYGLYYKDSIQHLLALPENADVLLKFLNSLIMQYYISKTSVAIQGGFPCYQKNFIEKFTLPELTQQEVEEIRLLDTDQTNRYLVQRYQVKLPDTYLPPKPSYEARPNVLLNIPG